MRSGNESSSLIDKGFEGFEGKGLRQGFWTLVFAACEGRGGCTPLP